MKARSARKRKDELYEAGLKVRKEVLTAEYVDRQFAAASEFTRPMQEMATRAWGLVWARPGLPHKVRSMLNIAFLVALDKPEELDLHTEAALRNGVTEGEILEILMQAAVYCGFPAALRGTRVARQAVERYAGKAPPKKASKRARARR
jgi:4-carboxymuconolactone decarboxylase